MTTFAYMSETRWWAGEVTDAARHFAAGDDDRLAAAAFARLLHQHSIEFDWNRDDASRFVVGWGWAVRVKAIRMSDTVVPLEAFDADTPWVAYVNLAVDGLAVFVGFTYRTELELPVSQLLTFEEWARAFDDGKDIADAA
jgi:hypothetical protein